MDVIEAIRARHSVRDFDSKPVPKDTIMKIMEAAIYSPSGGNGQPWEVFVATGATLEKIRKIFKERFEKPSTGGPGPGGPPKGMPQQPAYIMERMATIRDERLKLLGLDPKDPASTKVFMEWGANLFNAPVVAVICMDKVLSGHLDIGMFIQSVCLAAQNFGVETFIASAFVSHQDVIRQELEIPEDLNIITGIGLGYANPDAIINTYRSPRRPVTEVVRYKE